MHELEELKKMLCRELEEYGRKGNLSSGTLDVVDKLAHTIKNIDKILEKDEEGGSYRGASYRGSYRGGNSYEDGGSSYERGRGSNARRDSMGRYATESMDYSRGYSRGKEMISELRELMEEAPDEHTRMEFEKFIKRVEKME